MVYGILKLLNFAHGDVFMVGAFIGYGVLTVLGRRRATRRSAIVAAHRSACSPPRCSAAGSLGVAIERFAYRPLRNAPRIAPLISALGVSFFLENSVAAPLRIAQFRTYDVSTAVALQRRSTSAAPTASSSSTSG